MNVRIFHHIHLEQQISLAGLNISDLKNDFKRYKETGITPDNPGNIGNKYQVVKKYWHYNKISG